MASKIYFASDFHLGTPSEEESRERERRIISWLDFIKKDASELYLMGDIFDFWFEYKHVVPKGYIRFLGKLAELSDAGIKLTFFKGNHDMWMFNYFKEELDATIVSDELIVERNHKRFYLHHGDGLGPGDMKYKLLKKIFRSDACQWLFARLHPNFGIGIARMWSKHSRITSGKIEDFKGEDKEWLISYIKQYLNNRKGNDQKKHIDYFVFGHRHLPLSISVENSLYINLGEWINFYTYAVFDGENMELKVWP
jgi:UDP-2,3-diacylglucosamine hydrolase